MLKRSMRLLSVAGVLASAVVLAFSACSPFVSSGGQGEILVYLGGDASSRALSDPPFSQIPVFSSYTLRVSGPGMDPVELTIDGAQTSFSTMVPGGSDRVVELYAPVDWDATALAYPDNVALRPTLVLAYGATTTLDVIPGQRVTAVLRLEVAETKILLPDAYSTSQLYIADGLHPEGALTSTALSAYSNTDYEFDRYGRLLYTLSVTVYLAQNEADSAPVSLAFNGDDLAYDRGSDILYAWYDGDGSYLNGYDYGSESPNAYLVNHPVEYEFGAGSIAVDAQGYIYVPLLQYSSGFYGLGKLTVGTPSSGFADTQVVTFQPFSVLDLESPLEIRDMMVKDGKLYVLAGENVSEGVPHHGKVVEIDLSTLTLNRDLGWTSTDYPTDSVTQLYGPQRFIALAPRKLIFADEGFNGTDEIDRVVEVDLESWSISSTGFDGAVSFFNDYNYVYVC